MSAELYSGERSLILGLLRRESGLRKAARIMLFMDRGALVAMLLHLPDAVVVALSREMARLKAQIQDMRAECERIRSELGAYADVIELQPPDPNLGANAFAFLSGLSAASLASLQHSLSEEQLAAVICNAPVEEACRMLSGARSRMQREQWVEAMTRLKRSSPEAAEELALQTRQSLQGAFTALRKQRGVSATTQLRRELKGVFESSLSPDEAAASDDTPLTLEQIGKQMQRDESPDTSAFSLAELITRADPRELQRALASVPIDHLALALVRADESLRELCVGNLSPRRRDDLAAEMAACGEVSGADSRDARRAVARRLAQALGGDGI